LRIEGEVEGGGDLNRARETLEVEPRDQIRPRGDPIYRGH
jgi:hypothetical protein